MMIVLLLVVVVFAIQTHSVQVSERSNLSAEYLVSGPCV